MIRTHGTNRHAKTTTKYNKFVSMMDLHSIVLYYTREWVGSCVFYLTSGCRVRLVRWDLQLHTMAEQVVCCPLSSIQSRTCLPNFDGRIDTSLQILQSSKNMKKDKISSSYFYQSIKCTKSSLERATRCWILNLLYFMRNSRKQKPITL